MQKLPIGYTSSEPCRTKKCRGVTQNGEPEAIFRVQARHIQDLDSADRGGLAQQDGRLSGQDTWQGPMELVGAEDGEDHPLGF